MREKLRGRRPSPAMVVSIFALVFALAGTGVASVATISVLSKKDKKKVKTIANNQITKRSSGLTVAKAKDADALAGKSSAALETGGSSDERGDLNALTTSDEIVLSAAITLPATKRVTAVASVEALSNGGGDDNINCNLEIAGVDGVRQTTYITPNALDDSTTLPLTQSRVVGAGTHTVIVECNEGGTSATSVEERSLSVVSTG